VVEAVRHWSTLLEACDAPFTIYTDHQALQYFQSSQRLLPRHVRWSQDLNCHAYNIKYRPARQNCKADALSRRPDYDSPLSPVIEPILQPVQVTTVTVPRLNAPVPPASPAVSPKAALPSILSRIHTACQSDPSLSALPRPPQFSPPNDSPVLYHNAIYVPPDNTLRSDILTLAHDSTTAGHPGRDRTIDLIRRVYNWPGLPNHVRRYVSSCDTCQKTKPSHLRQQGLLKPLPVPSRPWSSMTWDYIGPLPNSSGFDAILVIVDRFTKLAHFVPANTTDNARTLARHFLRNVFRLHGLPDHIISDRGPTFASAWWKEFCSILGPEVRLSTAFHPQTDGQTERTNQSIEHYIRCFTNYLQTDWSSLLDTAEFTYNNARHSSTTQSPFFTAYGFHPLALLDSSVDSHVVSLSSLSSRVTIPDAARLADRLSEAHQTARTALATAAERMSVQVDAHRRDTPEYCVGDVVLVRADHIHTTRPSKKLGDKNIGPFTITHVLGTHNYRLEVGNRHIHNVFHVDRLIPYTLPDSFPGRPRHARPPPDTADEQSYEVADIIDSRRHHRTLQYFVRWKGYGDEDMQWVSSSDFDHDDPVVLDFAQKHPSKPITPATKSFLSRVGEGSYDTE